MSAPSARPFLATLRSLEPELHAPLPRRVRILRELEADLEEMQARFVARGMPELDARARALEMLVPDGAALGALSRVHAPPYARLTRRMDHARARLLERSALAGWGIIVLVGATLALRQAGIFSAPPVALWPVLALGVPLLAAVGASVFSACAKNDPIASERGAAGVLGLSGAVVVAALGAGFFDLYRLSATLALEPERASALVPGWAVRECTLLAVAGLLALLGGLAWFVLTQWLSAARAAHRDALGLEP